MQHGKGQHRPLAGIMATTWVVGSVLLSMPAVAEEKGSDVEVRSALVPRSAADPIAASSVVRGAELEAAGQSSADVLARVPGVAVQRTGAQSDLATASIRGADSTQVPVYVAGVRVNDDVSGTADLSTVPLWMMDRVEVFRGNAPASGDQLGIGGAIFFWPRLPRRTRAGAGASIGSFGALGGSVAGEVGNERAGALLAVRRDQADNDYQYVNDGGRRFDLEERVMRRRNADFVAHDAWAIGRYRLSRTDSFSTVMNAFEREQGVTGLALEPSDHARATTRRLLTGVSGKLGCPGARDDCKVDVQASLLAARVTYEDPRLEVPSIRSALLSSAGQRAVVRAFVTSDVGTVLSLGAGVAESVEAIRVDRQGALSREGNRASTHLVATATLAPLAGLRVMGLAALDCHTTSGIDDQFDTAPLRRDSGVCGTLAPAGRLGASYALSREVELVANLGRYVRMPTLTELYGSSPLVQGNAALSPETGQTADVGLRAAVDTAAGRYGVDTFAFARFAGDLIRYRLTSFGVAGPYNVGRARFLGVEAAVSGQWWNALRASVSATAMDPKDTTEGSANPTTNDILPLTSRLVVAARLEAFAARGLGILRQDRAALALVYLHRASRFADPAGQVVLPEQHFVDVEATTAHLDGGIVGRLAVRNVSNVQQYDLLGLPLPRRSFHAELQAWW